MSIRYLNAAEEITYISSLEKLFDPRVNTFYSNAPLQGIKPTTALNLLNTLYSPENLLNYEVFKHLVYDGSFPTLEEHQHFLNLSQAVPYEQRWLFYSIRRRRGRATPDSNHQLSISQPTGNVMHSGPHSFIDTTSISIESPSPQQFVELINNLHEQWYTRFFSHVPEGNFWFRDYLHTSSNFIYELIKYTCCNKYAVSLNGQQVYNPLKVIHSLNADPNLQLKVDLEGRTYQTKFFIPVSENNRSTLYTIMNYTTNVLNVLPYPNKTPKEKDPILVGVELEVATDYSMRDLIDAAKEPFFIGKSDASITGSKHNKVELVTAPSSFKYLKRAYAQWLNNLDYTKFDTTTTTNNGMHVHVGREHFEDNTHIRNFCWFFNNPANSDFLIYISERGNYEAMMRYSPFYQFPQGCTRTKAFRQVYHFLGSGFRGITNFKGGWESAKTVEVRMFRGVVSYASIVKNLEFVEAIFNFTKGLTSYRQLSLSGFLSWLKETPSNKYILLKKFIDMGNMDKMTAAADVKDILFNETNEEKIVNLLKHSTLKLTNEHISVLNRGKKRTFQLDKTTGEITIIYHNRSKLQPLDKSFAERYLRV
jgi:hypothetical protein